MGVVQYGEKVVHEFKLSDYKSVKDVVKRAQSIHQRGGEETNTALGINVARYYVSLCGATFGHTRPYFAFSYFASLNSSATDFLRRSQAFKQGGRRGAKKVMIVITDGESHDSQNLQQAIEDSEKDGITRYAVAVSPIYSPGLNGCIFFFFMSVPTAP